MGARAEETGLPCMIAHTCGSDHQTGSLKRGRAGREVGYQLRVQLLMFQEGGGGGVGSNQVEPGK